MKSLKRVRNLSQLNIIALANGLGLKKYNQAKRFLFKNSKPDNNREKFITLEYKLIQEKKSTLSRQDRDRVIMLYKRQTMAEQKSEALSE
ncbi:MAG: hypothetical protein JXN64_13270 [Spirochaetes bacterium]|nr:hypothetical protein [Spirochaetota bacterium]